MRYQKHIAISSFIAFALNLCWGGAVLGQSNQSTVNINRTGSLSFANIPSSFDFGTIAIPGIRTPTFTDPGVNGVDITNLPSNKIMYVQDTRGTGGFMVTLSANGNLSDGGTNTIAVSNASPNDNLRIVSTPRVNVTVPAATAGGVLYETGLAGPQTVSAPVNTAATNFGLESTFTSVTNNILDTTVPVVVLDGTLASTDGRIGRMGVGVSSMLYIPAYQAPGQYTTTLTWTLTDSTN